MKLLKNFFILVMVITLTACSGDDNDSVPYELNNTNLSAGSFQVQELSFTYSETFTEDGEIIVIEASGFGETFQLLYTFFENGTYIIDGEYVQKTTIRIDGEVVEQTTEIITNNNATGTYVVNDSTMQIIVDEESVYDITLFNENELRISRIDIYSENGANIARSEEIRLIR